MHKRRPPDRPTGLHGVCSVSGLGVGRDLKGNVCQDLALARSFPLALPCPRPDPPTTLAPALPLPADSSTQPRLNRLPPPPLALAAAAAAAEFLDVLFAYYRAEKNENWPHDKPLPGIALPPQPPPPAGHTPPRRRNRWAPGARASLAWPGRIRPICRPVPGAQVGCR